MRIDKRIRQIFQLECLVQRAIDDAFGIQRTSGSSLMAGTVLKWRRRASHLLFDQRKHEFELSLRPSTVVNERRPLIRAGPDSVRA